MQILLNNDRNSIDCGVHGDLTIVYPKPYSIHLKGAIGPKTFRV